MLNILLFVKTRFPYRGAKILICIIFFATTAMGSENMEEIKSVHIGLVRSVVEKEGRYFVTLDNGFSATLERPVPEGCLGSEASFEPYSMNNAVALISYTSGRTDWRPARVGIPVWGVLMVDEKAHDVREFGKKITYGTTTYVSQLRSKKADADCVRIEGLPVPGFYQLYFFSRFFQESYDALVGSMALSYEDAYTKPVCRVDMAYEQAEEFSGYTVIFIQKSRFKAP